MKSIHRTTSGRKAKELREEARTWKGEARKIRAAAPELEPAAREREMEAERLEAEALEALEEARLEALTVYLGPVEKITAKDIDSTLCEHAREVKEKFGIENIRYLDAQKARIDLIKAVMEM